MSEKSKHSEINNSLIQEKEDFGNIIKNAKNRYVTIVAGDEGTNLEIGDLGLECYVAVNSKGETVRLIARSDIQKLFFLDPRRGTALEEFFRKKIFSPFISDNVLGKIKKPLYGQRNRGGQKTALIDAEILPDLCIALTKFNREKSRESPLYITKEKEDLAIKQAQIILESIAKIGIVSLVDEVTGYQKQKDEYQLMVKRYIADALRDWLILFPESFYKQIYRLYNWNWKGYKVTKKNHPQCVAYVTNDLYKRLPAGSVVITELKYQ